MYQSRRNQLSRFFQLPNGVVFDIDLVQVIIREELNSYVIVLAGCQASPRCNGSDLEQLLKHMDVTVIQEPSKVLQ